MSMINEFRPYMPRGMERAEAPTDPTAGPVEKSAKAPQTAAPKPELTPLQVERFAEVLRGYTMKVTEENINLLKTMLENGIPLTKENILHMNHAMKLAGSADNALFMIQNNVKLTQANAAQLNGLVNGQTNISQQINSLLAAIDNLSDTALAAQLKQILTGGGNMQAQAGQNATGTTTAELAQMPQAGQSAVTGDGALQSQATAQPVTQTASPPPTLGASQNTAAQEAPGLTQPTAQVATQAMATNQPAGQNQGQAVTATPQEAGQATSNTAQVSGQPSATQTQQGQQAAQNTQMQGGQAQATQGTQPQAAQPAPLPAGAPPAQIPAQFLQAAQSSQSSQAALPQSGAQPTAAQTPQSPLPQGLQFHLADSTSQEVTQYLNNLREAIAQVQQALTGRASDDVSRVLQEARTLESHIDFASQIKNQTFVQLPLFHNGQETQMALHVYKDAKKSGGSSSGSSSALIALETAGMGHFETYVQKNASSVHCQFRLESDKVVRAVRDNIHKLDALLKNHNYSLDSFSFLPPGEKYTLLDSPQIFDDLTKVPNKTDVRYFDKKA